VLLFLPPKNVIILKYDKIIIAHVQFEDYTLRQKYSHAPQAKKDRN
jgi:hypothetical protein